MSRNFTHFPWLLGTCLSISCLPVQECVMKSFLLVTKWLYFRGNCVLYKHLVSIFQISSTWACVKSQALESALTHHIIAFTQYRTTQFGIPRASCWHVCSLSVYCSSKFAASGPIWTDTVPRLAARPWPLLTNRAERTFRISKGEREAEGVPLHLGNQHETETDRETRELFTVHHHSESWLYSSPIIWALQLLSAGMKPDLSAALCFNRHVQWQIYTLSLIYFSFYCLFILSREISGLPKPRWFEPCNLYYSERG